MKLSYWGAILICLFAYTPSVSMVSPGALGFSNLIPNSDLIVKGEVIEVSKVPGEYRISFQVNDFLLGITQAQILEIVVPLAKNRYLQIPHQPYLEQGVYILCLSLDAEAKFWRVVNAEAGVLHVDSENDVRYVIAQFQSNQNLFSNSQALQDLFSTSHHWQTKQRLLQDLEKALSIEGHPFLNALLDSGDDKFQSFAALQAGRLKVLLLRDKLLSLAESSTNERVIAHCIVGLGDLGNIQTVSSILNFINSSDAFIRTATLESIGKIGGDVAIEALRKHYLSETSKNHRMTIIDGILRHNDASLRKDILAQFQSVEEEAFLKTILSRRLREH